MARMSLVFLISSVEPIMRDASVILESMPTLGTTFVRTIDRKDIDHEIRSTII